MDINEGAIEQPVEPVSAHEELDKAVVSHIDPCLKKLKGKFCFALLTS